MILLGLLAAFGFGCYLTISQGPSLFASTLILSLPVFLIYAFSSARRAARRFFRLGWDAKLNGEELEDWKLEELDVLEWSAFGYGHSLARPGEDPDAAFNYREIKRRAREAFSLGLGR